MRIIQLRGEQIKLRDLIKRFEKNGWNFYREGSNHTLYEKDGQMEAIPRHNEINEKLARSLIRKWGLK